jgi:hypothetical protein
VNWTPWGSFYGPAMLTHVRCPECGYAYNGRTGRSNLVGIIIFTMIPILLLVGIDVALWFLLEPFGPTVRLLLIALYAGQALIGAVMLLLAVLRPTAHSTGRRRREEGGD